MHLRSILSSVILLPLLGCSSSGGASKDAPGVSAYGAEPGTSSSVAPAQPSGSASNPANPTATPTSPTAGTGEQPAPSIPLTDGMPMAGGTPMMGGTPPAGMPTPPAPLPTEQEECTREFTMPTFQQLQANPKLPDPFTFLDGSKVVTKADWACRRKEISLLAQQFIYGPKPPAPDSETATFDNGNLNITLIRGNTTVQFAVPVQTPQGAGPFPGILSLGGLATTADGVAILNIRNATTQFAAAAGMSRQAPSGDFYRLWPEYMSTGSLMAWAWMGSRVVDALLMTTGHNVDTSKLSALGCSRDGKEAGTIGLFDDRFAMVAAQSPGSGMTSGWRVAESVGTSVQTAGEIYGENTWLGAVFQPFSGQNVNKLPVDQHEVLALAWPRPLIMMEGTNDSWNCPLCSYTTMKYTQMVYQALGSADDIAFPEPPHTHCAQAGTFSEQYYDAFVNRFLKDQADVSTANLFTDSNFMFDNTRWQDGPIPTLQ